MRPSAVPIGAYYLALCGAMGLYLPYLSLYLASVGLSDAAAVQVQAVVPLMGLFVPPLLGLLADARHARVWLLRGFSAATAVTFAALGVVGGHVVAVAVVLAAFALARAPLISLADTTAHEHVLHHGGSYGRLRTWGSGGYLVLTLLAGALYDATSIRWMVWATTAVLVALVVCAWWMPAAPPRREGGALGDLGRLLRTRALWWFLAAVAFGQPAGTCYDTSLALHLRQLGYAKNFLGLVVAVGVGAEVVLLTFSGAIVARVRAERTLVAAFMVGTARWLLLSVVTSKAALLLQAPLHALSFALYWVSGTTLVREYAGPRASAAGQGLFGAAVAVGAMVGNLGGGALFARGGGRLLFSVTAVSAAIAAGLAAVHVVARRQTVPRAA